ncbi:2-iminoacetate synthase ThiH [Candidatus Erwinia haradaeae]|uniref:2-iminoacetate synthase n=1 Tax=Candidatus Erwinia haradaeae TaxID=1922217 RepID=A0A451D5E0_9GAMM|nr:2-iminoacetate synthase ThiH [Candidatus Erwinia haradaeae]VFP80840.1 2-iminoacetate synthase [Candidatus Erwinia haradaeae]
METFSNKLKEIQWDVISSRIHKQTIQDVERALMLENLGLQEMMALLSPIGINYLESIAQRAYTVTRQRFGNTVTFYLPLYLSNLCANDCTYCGFSMKNRIRRKILSKQEIIKECEAIHAKGINHLLLVTGEHQTKVGIEYFRRYVPLIRNYCSSLIMEVQPMLQENYEELIELGLDGVLVYQETYHTETYSHHHLYGKKQDFLWRLETPDRLARSGIDKIGLGILIGLSDDWRTDCYILAKHLLYLRKTYWKSRYSLSFPRLRPFTGSAIDSLSTIGEAELLQVMCAFRLLVPEVEISLSTRESPYFRDHTIPIVVNNISAGSKTQPGGYTNNPIELEQFLPNDNRSPKEIAQVLRLSGLQPVWKDWDPYLGHSMSYLSTKKNI